MVRSERSVCLKSQGLRFRAKILGAFGPAQTGFNPLLHIVLSKRLRGVTFQQSRKVKCFYRAESFAH